MSNTTELCAAIDALRQEIESLEDADAETREQLISLADIMQARLNSKEQPSDPPAMDGVKDLIETYEARHPRIVAMANDLATRLAAMGI